MLVINFPTKSWKEFEAEMSNGREGAGESMNECTARMEEQDTNSTYRSWSLIAKSIIFIVIIFRCRYSFGDNDIVASSMTLTVPEQAESVLQQIISNDPVAVVD